VIPSRCNCFRSTAETFRHKFPHERKPDLFVLVVWNGDCYAGPDPLHTSRKGAISALLQSPPVHLVKRRFSRHAPSGLKLLRDGDGQALILPRRPFVIHQQVDGFVRAHLAEFRQAMPPSENDRAIGQARRVHLSNDLFDQQVFLGSERWDWSWKGLRTTQVPVTGYRYIGQKRDGSRSPVPPAQRLCRARGV